MPFRLAERPESWIETAPIRIVREFEVGATPTEVFAAIADHEQWPKWFKKMRRVRIDGPKAGVGALRTVWVGAASVQEHFVRWDPNERVTFNIVRSSLPGMAAMTEDWSLAPHGDSHTMLRIVIAVEAVPLLRPLSGVLRSTVAASTAGASGIVDLFARGER